MGRLRHLAKQWNAECASFENAHHQSGQTGILTTIEAMNISTVELESSWLALDIESQKAFCFLNAFYENRSSNLCDIMANLFLFLSPVSTNRHLKSCSLRMQSMLRNRFTDKIFVRHHDHLSSSFNPDFKTVLVSNRSVSPSCFSR